MNRSGNSAKFVVATPTRTSADDFARALENIGSLRFIALGTRRGTAGVPPERTRLNPMVGLCAYAAAKLCSPYRAESFRLRLHPWFDGWVKRQLTPGDHIISSYGFTNDCFRFVRAHGGKTFIDAGNSHIENFQEVLVEEHRRWRCPYPPLPSLWYERSRAMLPMVDYVLSPSFYVTRSFLDRGFKPEQILKSVYPLDLSLFKPLNRPRPADRPLTLINTGSLSLRKGAPYLLEAFRLLLGKIPRVRLRLIQIIEDSFRPILPQYGDLPIDWSPPLRHEQLSELLRTADMFVLPSLEDGFARTISEALACGLPVITTPNTGASDLIQSGVNGEVVPIRDPRAIADAVCKWADRILAPDWQPRVLLDAEQFSFGHFQHTFISQMRELKLA